jgi:hypothetical protein
MAQQLFLEGVESLDDLSGVPLACTKTGKGEFTCKTIGKGMRSVKKGTIVTKLVTEGKKKRGKWLSGQPGAEAARERLSAAAKACGKEGAGKKGNDFRACVSERTSMSGSKSSGYRTWKKSGKKSAAESAGFHSASRKSMGKRGSLAAAAKACKGKKGDAFRECVKSKAKKG